MSRPNHTKQPFFVSPYPLNATAPWKLEIRAYFAGKKIRRFFSTEAEAWTEGARMIALLKKHGTDGLEKQSGISIDQAVKMFLHAKSDSSADHVSKMTRVCRKLTEKFRGPISAIAPLQLSNWFAHVQGADTTRAGIHRYANMFFAWCHGMELIERNPFCKISAPRARPLRNILTAPEMTILLDAEMSDPIRAWLLLGGFTGLRSIEIRRMNWQDIDAKNGQIFIRPDVAKQADGMLERIVDFTDPLKKRADFFQGRNGTIVPKMASAFYKERKRVVAGLHAEKTLPWPDFPDNALRHSFATYHLARCKSAPQTAFQMGHTSPAMVQRTYAVPAARADWEAWWAV